MVLLLFSKQSNSNQQNFEYIYIIFVCFRYAGKLSPRGGYSSNEYRQKMNNLSNLVTYENTPSVLFENLLDRFV